MRLHSLSAQSHHLGTVMFPITGNCSEFSQNDKAGPVQGKRKEGGEMYAHGAIIGL